MVRYMNKMPEIRDPLMKDGTNAFFMALGRQDSELVKELLLKKREQDVRLATFAFYESKIKPDVKAEIESIIGPVSSSRYLKRKSEE